ncbi:MAG: DTW domain-containing protein [Deltaproteobacteria bacterium]|nr:DTW domain-containing protein [Deltaproteobacteria bacterium]
MHKSLCICQHIPHLKVAPQLRLLIHRREDLRTTNTGKLAALCLADSEVWVHGLPDQNLAAPANPSGPQLLLFPSDDAEPLSEAHNEGGAATLFVPDGSWRQARRMVKQLPWLDRMKKVCLPPGGVPSLYRLRTGRNLDDLATAEAIARAMGVLVGGEAGDEVRKAIENVFCRMVERTLFSRGLMPADEVFGGIPDGVQAHDPRPIAEEKDAPFSKNITEAVEQSLVEQAEQKAAFPNLLRWEGVE